MKDEMPLPPYHGQCPCEECQPDYWNRPQPEKDERTATSEITK